VEAKTEQAMDELRKEHLAEVEKLRMELGAEFESKLRLVIYLVLIHFQRPIPFLFVYIIDELELYLLISGG
jgi:hypothetical protein